jgi:hypothetical protein
MVHYNQETNGTELSVFIQNEKILKPYGPVTGNKLPLILNDNGNVPVTLNFYRNIEGDITTSRSRKFCTQRVTVICHVWFLLRWLTKLLYWEVTSRKHMRNFHPDNEDVPGRRGQVKEPEDGRVDVR